MNPIFKRVVRHSYSFSEGKSIAVREWVARCPRCNKLITAGQNMGMYGITQNSRKTAKDALFRHLIFKHRS